LSASRFRFSCKPWQVGHERRDLEWFAESSYDWVAGMESDEEIRRVPELGLELPGGASTSGREAGAGAGGPERAQSSTAQASSRRRVRSPADKEHKRLKRCEICSNPSNSNSIQHHLRIPVNKKGITCDFSSKEKKNTCKASTCVEV